MFYCMNYKICCITHRALSLGELFYLSTLLTHRLNTHLLSTTLFSPLSVPYCNKKFNGFSTFSYAASWFTLHPLTNHLETSKLIYSTKPFLLRLSSLSEILSGFWLLCTLDKLASNLSLLGELASCKSKNFCYNYYYIFWQKSRVKKLTAFKRLG